MKRLAYFCVDPGVPVFGTKGASVHVQEVVRAFRRLGWEVSVYCTRRGQHVPADLADLRIVELAVGKGPAAQREQSVASAAEALAETAALDGFDLAYERYSLFSTAGARAASILRRPFVVEVNAPLVTEQGRHRELVDVAGAWTSTRHTIESADLVACVSTPVATWVRQLVETAPVSVVPNGVNTTRIRPVAPPARLFTVGFVGTLKPWHGVEVLVDGFSRVATADWRLLLCGDGPERIAVEHLADRLGVSVEVTGAVPPDEVPVQLGRMHVAVAPYPAVEEGASHYFSPLKLYEYLAAGLPVVASAVGQTIEVLDHGTTGLLVPPSDPAALGLALRTLHDDPDLRRRLGGAGRAKAVDAHDWTSVVRAVLDRVPVVSR